MLRCHLEGNLFLYGTACLTTDSWVQECISISIVGHICLLCLKSLYWVAWQTIVTTICKAQHDSFNLPKDSFPSI